MKYFVLIGFCFSAGSLLSMQNTHGCLRWDDLNDWNKTPNLIKKAETINYNGWLACIQNQHSAVHKEIIAQQQPSKLPVMPKIEFGASQVCCQLYHDIKKDIERNQVVQKNINRISKIEKFLEAHTASCKGDS